jgi:hypothetical protein
VAALRRETTYNDADYAIYEGLNTQRASAKAYAPYVYKNGWRHATATVQNASTYQYAKVKFSVLDEYGNTVKYLVDWICPRDSQTVSLYYMSGIPDPHHGSALIESQPWTSPVPSIVAVVQLGEEAVHPDITGRAYYGAFNR